MKVKTHKGIGYFQDYDVARTIRDELAPAYPEVRLVWYTRGWGVQYRISGPYYPELE